MYCPVQWGFVRACFIAAASFVAACSEAREPPEPECLEAPAELDCEPLYGRVGEEIQPTFTELFTRTLQPTCGSSPVCHSGPDARGGLILDDEEAAHQALLAEGSDRRMRVKPTDVQCGKVIVRLETRGEPWSMPPGAPLDEQTLCVIRHWIANGAPR